METRAVGRYVMLESPHPENRNPADRLGGEPQLHVMRGVS